MIEFIMFSGGNLVQFDFEKFDLVSLLTLLGGLSVFLYGLEILSQNMKKIAGSTLKLILEKVTENPFMGVFIGMLVTSIIQSSSATTSILVSLVQSQIISFERTVAVIMGSNIGTTITAQIVAFKITKWSLPIIFLGFMVLTLAKKSKNQALGFAIMGLGFLFFGLEIMSSSMKVLRSSEFFLGLMKSLENIPLGILIGTLFTALVQSSSASIGIMIGMASSGLVSVEASIPIILGANIGTCITAILASIKASAEAKRVAAAHVIFNIGGVILFSFFIPQSISIVKLITPGDEILRIIANFHTLFNIASTLLWLPFIKQLTWLSNKIIKDGEAEKRRFKLPIVNSLNDSSDLLLVQSESAIRHFKNLVKSMLWTVRGYLANERIVDNQELNSLRIEQQDFRREILDFLSRIVELELNYKNAYVLVTHTTLVNEIENIGHKTALAVENLEGKIPNFDAKHKNLDTYFRESIKLFSKTCNAILKFKKENLLKLIKKIDSLKLLEKTIKKNSLKEICPADKVKQAEHKMTLEILELIRSINDGSKNICQILLDENLV